MGIAVDGESITRPALIRQLPSAFDRADKGSCRGRSFFTDVEVDASLYDTRFLHKVKRGRTLVAVTGHVDELVEIHLRTRTRFVGTDFTVVDDMIAIAGDRPSSANGFNQAGAGLV